MVDRSKPPLSGNYGLYRDGAVFYLYIYISQQEFRCRGCLLVVTVHSSAGLTGQFVKLLELVQNKGMAVIR